MMQPIRTIRSLAGALFALCLLMPSVEQARAALPIQSWTAPSGARVLFVESHDLPMLDVSVELPAGSARDKPESSGLASLTQRLLRLGADGMDEDEIARRLADVGANLNVTFDVDRAGYTLRTLSSAAEQQQALSVLGTVLQSPSFPEAVLAREKSRVIAGLKESDTKPDVIAARTLARLLFREHPYALRTTGEADTVAKLTREDLATFYQTYYRRDQAVVSIMGDVTRERAQAIAEALTHSLPAATAPLAELPPVTKLPAAVERIVEHPSAQSHVMIGQPGVARGDPDYFPLLVANHILGGGGMTSRLYDQVRDKRGLSYSVYSMFVPYQRPGPFQIGLQTRRDQAQEAVSVVRKVLADFAANGPTAAELKAAQENLVGGFALRIDSNQKILTYLAVIGFYRLPLDYLDTFSSQIEAVTLEQVRDAFRRHVDPERLATVVVGAGNAQ
jgi:zinc protease